MTPELQLILILLKKEAFASFFSSLDLKQLRETARELWFLYDSLERLHAVTSTDLALSELELFFYSTYPEADRIIYGAMFQRLHDVGTISDDVANATLNQYKNRENALKLSEAAYSLSKGVGSVEALQTLLEGFKGLPEASEKRNSLRLVSTNIEQIYEQYKAPGLRWPLDCLNKSLGSLRSGDFGFIFARPETGKTTFLACTAAHMLQLETTPVVDWFNNEEEGNKVMLRLYQAYFGVPLDKLFSNLKYYRERFEHETAGRCNLYDGSNIHYREIEDLVSKDDPALVIYDQLTKIRGFDTDRKDLELGEKFQWAREFAKRRHAAIGCSQADGTAEGQKRLNMDHVSNAKTAVQAEADFILGIGKVHDPKYEYVRYINISKNKLIGDDDTNPELRHGFFETYIEPQIARYKDTMSYE